MSAFNASTPSNDTRSAPRHLLAGAAVVVLDDPEPVVKTSDAATLGAFVRHGDVDRPGVYIALWKSAKGTHAYVGQSGRSVATRLRDPKFRLLGLPKRVVTVIDDRGALTSGQTRVVERVLHLMLLASGVPILGDIPVGAVVTDAEYGMVRHFCANAIHQMREAHLAFGSLPPRLALAGPVTEPGVVLDTVPGGMTFRLTTRHATADLVETSNAFVLVSGSSIRDPGHAPETRSIGVLRQELVYAGILMRDGSGRFIVTKPLRFTSASAATRFVTGATAGTPGSWKAVGGYDGQSLRRVPKVVRVQPILPQFPTPTNDPVHVDDSLNPGSSDGSIGGLGNG